MKKQYLSLAILFAVLMSFTVSYAELTSITVTYPADGDIIGEIVTLEATLGQSDTADNVTFLIDGVEIGQGTDQGNSTYTVDLDTTQYTDGYDYEIKAEATNGTYTISDSIFIDIDNTYPNITLYAPRAYYIGGGTAALTIISFSADDNIEIDMDAAVNVSAGSTTLRPMSCIGSGAGAGMPFTSLRCGVDWDITTASDGVANLTITVTDKAGWQRENVYEFYIDNTAPTISNEAVDPAAYVSEFNPAEFTANFSDVALSTAARFIVDSSDLMLMGIYQEIGNDTNVVTDYSYSESWDGAAYQITDGTNTSDTTVFFGYGNTIVRGVLDKENNGSTIDGFMIAFDSNGEVAAYSDAITNGTSVFTPQSYDRVLDDWLNSSVSFTLYDEGLTSNPILESIRVASGDYVGVIEVSDVAGNIAQSSDLSITVDNDAPTINSFTLLKSTPIERGDSLTETDFNYTASDNYDVNLTAMITGLDTSTIGTKTATLTVTDDAGNSASTTLDYEVVDTTAPVISNIIASDITQSSAKISWGTNENTNYTVNYGTDQANLTETLTATDFLTVRNVGISGLSASTTYYYKITVMDESGNSADSAVQNFTTLAPQQGGGSERRGGGGGGGSDSESSPQEEAQTQLPLPVQSAPTPELELASELAQEPEQGNTITGAFVGIIKSISKGKLLVYTFVSLLAVAILLAIRRFLFRSKHL